MLYCTYKTKKYAVPLEDKPGYSVVAVWQQIRLRREDGSIWLEYPLSLN